MANPQVQLRALKAIPPLVDVIDYGTLRSVVYPRLEVRACVLIVACMVSTLMTTCLLC